jgi:DNA-binding transcriptional regulator YdaS (Cro superfamily)
MNALQRAIDAAGGLSALASRLDVLPQHVNNWRKRRVPAEYCVDIVNAVGGVVTEHDLRPDVFPAPPEPTEPDPDQARIVPIEDA